MLIIFIFAYALFAGFFVIERFSRREKDTKNMDRAKYDNAFDVLQRLYDENTKAYGKSHALTKSAKKRLDKAKKREERGWDNAVFECDDGLCPAREFCFSLGDKMENCDKSFIVWQKPKRTTKSQKPCP